MNENNQLHESFGVIKGINLISVKYCDGFLYFVHPYRQKFVGKYSEIKNKISDLSVNAEIPTMGEAASLIYSALQNPNEEFAEELIDCMQGTPFIVNSGLLINSRGVYVVDNPKIDNEGRIIMDEDEIRKSFGGPRFEDAVYIGNINHSKNGYVRHISPGFVNKELGNQPSSVVKNHDLVGVLAGIRGRKTLAEIATTQHELVYIAGDTYSLEPETHIPSLFFSTKDKRKLVIAADRYNDNRNDGFTVPRLSSARIENIRALENFKI